MIGVVLAASGGYIWGDAAPFTMVALAYASFAIFLAGRREDEAKALMAEIRAQALERGFDLPPEADLRVLVKRLRKARSPRNLLTQIFG